jgi:hypothetical protein
MSETTRSHRLSQERLDARATVDEKGEFVARGVQQADAANLA